MYCIYADGQPLYYPMSPIHAVTAPKLTLEMGKSGSLTFGIPQINELYGTLRKLKSHISVEYDGVEVFRGRILSEERNFTNIRTTYCEGDLSYLVDSVQKNEAYEGTTHDFFRKVVNAHNERVDSDKRFKVGLITIEDRPILISGQSDVIQDAETGKFNYKQIAINASTSEWKTTFDYIQDCLITYCGGYLRTRREADGLYLDYLLTYGSESSQEIEFGVNLLDLTEEVSVEELFTVLIPLGDENLNIKSVNNDSDELVDEAAASLYGRICKTHVFEGVSKAETLKENAQRYLDSNVNVPVTVTIRAVDLHLLNPDIQEIHVGDRVRVKSAPHAIVEYMVCTRIEYDLENPSNTIYFFGNPKQTLTQRYKKDKAKSSGGGGGGGPAQAASDEAKEELQDFYDAWINVDPDAAHVDLGALSKIVTDTRKTLTTEVGIDLDGVSGNINIKSLKSTVDEHGEEISNQALQINLIQQDAAAQMELIAAYDTRESEHYAALILRADALESSIELKADRVTVNSSITTINSDIIELNGRIDEIEANYVLASRLESETLKIFEKATIADLKTGYFTCGTLAQIKTLYATGAVIGSLIVDGGTAATQDWVLEQLASYAKSDHTHDEYAESDHTHSGYASSSHSHAWSAITGKPSTFTPASHKHGFSGSTQLAWGHQHSTYSSFEPGDNTGGVVSYAAKTISISGTTDSN